MSLQKTKLTYNDQPVFVSYQRDSETGTEVPILGYYLYGVDGTQWYQPIPRTLHPDLYEQYNT